MGVGPGVLSLYALMRRDALLRSGDRIIELGAQVLVCNGNQQAVLNLFEAFSVPPPGLPELKKLAEGSSARTLFERLGMKYWCVDASGEHGALKWDLNFDECAPEHRGLYQFVTNHGTTEHLLNQLNAFKIIHDLAAPGGLIMHALPFLSYLDHGYFNYHPNLFIDLARANGYELLGMWINIDPKFSHFIPWERGLEKHLQSGASDSLLLVLFRKTMEEEFSVPFQTVFAHLVPEPVLQRYRYVVDGQAVSGRRGLFLSMEDFMGKISGRRLLLELLMRVLRRPLMVLRGRPF